MPKRENQTTISLDPALKKQVQKEAIDRGATLGDAIAEGLHWWLNRTESANEISSAAEAQMLSGYRHLSKECQQWVKVLIEIFLSKNQKAYRAVTENLDVFNEYVELHKHNGTTVSPAEAANPGQKSASSSQDAKASGRSKRTFPGRSPGIGKTGTDGG